MTSKYDIDDDYTVPAVTTYSGKTLIGNWDEERRGQELLDQHENEFYVSYESTSRQSYQAPSADYYRETREYTEDIVERLKQRQQQAKMATQQHLQEETENQRPSSSLLAKKRAQWQADSTARYEPQYTTTHSASFTPSTAATAVATDGVTRKPRTQSFTRQQQPWLFQAH